jgi:hypothetical protein
MAAGIIAVIYDEIHCLSCEEVARRLEKANCPNPSAEKNGLQQAMGEVGKEIAGNSYSFLGISKVDYQILKQKILTHWDDIVKIASEVPSKDEIVSLLLQANGVHSPQGIGISEEEVEQAIRWAAYLRPRFTILDLYHLLDLNDSHK